MIGFCLGSHLGISTGKDEQNKHLQRRQTEVSADSIITTAE